MSGAIGATLIILAVFGGIGLVVGLIMYGIMILEDQTALPFTPEWRVRVAAAAVREAESKRMVLAEEERIDAMLQSRLDQARLPRGDD